jgi:L-ascorbate metabolism protein UlaG (beta-lactamase superfamily)
LKITRFTHSCVLVEKPERTALFDPGGYSWDALNQSLDQIINVDRLAISHKHEDHCNVDFVKSLVDKFPDMHIVCNDEVENYLQTNGVEAIFRGEATACTRGFAAEHGHLSSVKDVKPKNTAFHFMNSYSHPGDSLTLESTTSVLAVPFVSIWGSVDQAIEMVLELRPDAVVPIHDWHFSEEARKHLYEKLEHILPDTEIVALEHGESVEL